MRSHSQLQTKGLKVVRWRIDDRYQVFVLFIYLFVRSPGYVLFFYIFFFFFSLSSAECIVPRSRKFRCYCDPSPWDPSAQRLDCVRCLYCGTGFDQSSLDDVLPALLLGSS